MSREVPEGWVSTTLGELTQISGGTTPSKEVASFWEGGKHFWATPTDITALAPGQMRLSRTKTMVTESALEKTSLKMLPVGSVLMTSRATIGYPAINTVPMSTNQGFANFHPSEKHDAVFLANWIVFSRATLERSAGGSTFPEISKAVLKSLPIALPPLPEQRRIAEILSSVDEAIAATRAVIEQTRKVKQGVLERLLTKGIGHTRFKQTEIGEIPEGWEVANFGSVFKLASGKLKSVKNLATEQSEVSPYAAYGGNGIAGYSSDYLVDGDLVVIGRVGEYCGSAYRSSGRAWITDNALYTKEFLVEVDRDFVAYAFSRVPLENIRGGGGQPLVSQAAIYAQMLALPNLDEQKAIVQILKSFDSTTSDLRLLTLETTKSALMSDLLTGRKRVTDALPVAAE